MTDNVTIWVDDKEITVNPDKCLLENLSLYGIEIPLRYKTASAQLFLF